MRVVAALLVVCVAVTLGVRRMLRRLRRCHRPLKICRPIPRAQAASVALC